jgi:uncharacterized protein
MNIERSDRKRADETGVTRRHMLQTLGTGVAAATVGAALGRRHVLGADGTSGASTDRKQVVALRAEPFKLADVRLLDGPFRDAQKRNAKYLLQLEPDRMLHNFRVNAGLEPRAPVYGGWESVPMWADIRAHGHTLGHYLSACALMYASTADDEFKKRCEYIVADLQECQNSGGTGLVCAFPDKTAQIDNLIAGRRVIGVPWYTLHKIFAGLRDVHLHTGNTAALDVLVKLSDWVIATTQNMTDAQFERMLRTEHGGMNEVLADVFTLTGDAKHLTLSERFCHKQVLEPLSESRDTLNGLHSNTQIPKVIGFQRLHELTGKENYHAAAQFFWKTVVTNRSFATGGNADNEHFFPPEEFQKHLASAKTMETCCSHNMLKLTRALFSLESSAAYADYYERALYNTILASQDPDSGMMTYFQSTRPGYLKIYCTPIDSFWCCTGTGMENHAKYGDSIYFHGLQDGLAALYVNLFIPSKLNWKEKEFTLTQTTRFPEAGKTRLELAAANPVELALNIRHPGWCAVATVTVNGSVAATSRDPGTFIALKRTWNAGDVVDVDLPMTLRTEVLPGNTDLAAVVYGPIVLVGALGKQGIAPGADLHANERTIGEVLNEAVEVPVLVGDVSRIVEKIKPTESPLTFKSEGLGRPAEVTLVPYYRLAHERYNMYWKVLST